MTGTEIIRVILQSDQTDASSETEDEKIFVQSGRGNTKAKNEAFITILCLSVASICCRLPLPLVGMVLITFIERRFGFTVMSWTLVIVVFLLYLNFLVDPVIYMLRMPDIRRILKSTLYRMLNVKPGRKDVRVAVFLSRSSQMMRM